MTNDLSFEKQLGELYEGFEPAALDDERSRFAGKYWDYSNPGTYRFRMFPPPKGRKLPWVAVHRHWVRFPNKTFEIINCNKVAPIAAMRGPCYGCHWQQQLRQRGNGIDMKTAESLNLSISGFAEIIDRKAEAAGVQIMRFGISILNQFMALRDDEERCGLDFSHPLYGADLLLSVVKTKTSTTYVVSMAQNGKSPMARSKSGLLQLLQTRPGLDGELVYDAFEDTQRRIEAAAEGKQMQRDRDFVIPPEQVQGSLGAAPSGSNGANGASQQTVELPDDDEELPVVAEPTEPQGDYAPPPNTDDEIPF